jgi:serine protease Do
MKKIFFALFFLAQANQAFAETNSPEKTAFFKLQKEKNSAITPDTISPKQMAVNGFADIVEELMPAVVNISAVQEVQSSNINIDQLIGELPKTPLFDDFRNQLENQFRGKSQAQKKKASSIGSGFLISKDGFIVTNNHVIDGSEDITVSLADGAKYKAKVIGFDKKTDLALVKINAPQDLKFVKFGDSNKSRIGDWTIVIGNPYGLGGSVSVGIVSARGRDINNGQSDDFIQTDAAINKGNSGGPIFNSSGEVIGVSTAIFSPSGGSVGIGFGTPSSTAIPIIKQLKEQGEVTRGWLGVSVQDITDEMAESMKIEKTKGAFVVEVTKDSPAEKGGILPTDIITKFDDQEITEMKILPKTVAKYPVGKTAKVTVLRRGKVKVLNIKITKMKDEDSKKTDGKSSEKKQPSKIIAQILGLGLTEANSKLSVVEVSPKSEAADKGVMPGDVILSANQVPVASVSDLRDVIEDVKKGSKKLFLFAKRGESNYGVVLSVK